MCGRLVTVGGCCIGCDTGELGRNGMLACTFGEDDYTAAIKDDLTKGIRTGRQRYIYGCGIGLF